MRALTLTHGLHFAAIVLHHELAPIGVDLNCAVQNSREAPPVIECFGRGACVSLRNKATIKGPSSRQTLQKIAGVKVQRCQIFQSPSLELLLEEAARGDCAVAYDVVRAICRRRKNRLN